MVALLVFAILFAICGVGICALGIYDDDFTFGIVGALFLIVAMTFFWGYNKAQTDRVRNDLFDQVCYEHHGVVVNDHSLCIKKGSVIHINA